MNKKTIFVLILVFSVFSAATGYWFCITQKQPIIEEVRNENEILIKKLNNSKEKIDSLQNLLAEKNNTITKLEAEIDELDNKIEKLKDSIKTKTQKIKKLNNKLEKLKSLVDRKKEKINFLKDRVKELENLLLEKNQSINKLKLKVENLSEEIENLYQNGFVIDNSSFGVLAINEETGEGLVLKLETEYEIGDTELNIDIINTTYGEKYLQQSFRKALYVSTQISNVSLKNRSIDQQIYLQNQSEKFDLLKISGPSAGAAICLAQISVFENKTINHSILITGTINLNGTIGKVGEIKSKVKAAKEKGYELVLVPNDQYVDIHGIKVQEVSNITEAANILFKKQLTPTPT